jgi:hypothetical protein
MDQNLVSKLEKSISNLKNKSAKIYLFVQDTKGNARASIRFIYQIAMSLKNSGYNPIMLHEKPDYTDVSSWLDKSYTELPHKAVEGQNLEISPEDFIVVPEIFGFVMDQIKNLPCGKIVLSQAYDHILETLQPGQTWSSMNFTKCITTSELQKKYISDLMRNVSVDVLKPRLSKSFTKKTLPPKPIIGIHSRDQRDSLKVIKSFYLKFPQFRWVTFRDLRGLSENDFANTIKECFLCVWIDPTSALGTFPLECMKTGTPVIGKIPNMVPEWMNEKNGLWIQNENDILGYVADFLQAWLEDSINPEITEKASETAEIYSDYDNFDSDVTSLFNDYFTVRLNSFEDQLVKLQNNQ